MRKMSKLHIKKFNVYLADLSPQIGTETGKTRPVVVVQTDLLNNIHPSTMVCPITTNLKDKSYILRVHLNKGEGGIHNKSDIMIDQIRAIDNRRFIKHLGEIHHESRKKLINNLKDILE